MIPFPIYITEHLLLMASSFHSLNVVHNECCARVPFINFNQVFRVATSIVTFMKIYILVIMFIKKMHQNIPKFFSLFCLIFSDITMLIFVALFILIVSLFTIHSYIDSDCLVVIFPVMLLIHVLLQSN